MKEIFATCWLLYMGIAFVFTAFGIWSAWLLFAGLVLGLVFQFLT